MSFEALKLRLLDRDGRQVPDCVQATVVRAFERAATVPDANIDQLLRGAARVARVIAGGGAAKPDEYASSVLGRIAWSSQRQFECSSGFGSRPTVEVDSLEASEGSPSAITADIEIRRLLEKLDDRDRQIVTMRSRGWSYKEIAHSLSMLEVTVRCRYHLAKGRLRSVANRKR
jgi:DNA-directed RNA polymerase specialized sigma24 family protein